MYNKLKEPCNLLNLPPAPTKPPPTRKKILKIKDNQNNEQQELRLQQQQLLLQKQLRTINAHPESSLDLPTNPNKFRPPSEDIKNYEVKVIK